MCYPQSDKVVVAPATEPLTTAEIKTHLRVDGSDEDTYIGTLAQSARMLLEQVTHRAFVTQTRISRYDAFPPSFQHQRSPMQSVTSITYLDGAGASQTLSSALYTVDVHSEPARIVPVVGQSWPQTQDTLNAVTLTYVCGYGAASAVPEIVKTWIKRMVSHWFELREPITTGTILSYEDIPVGDLRSLLVAIGTGDYF